MAGVATRQQSVRNPTDVDVKIPAAGFGLAGTLTTPSAQGRLRHPAVVLVAGSGPIERDALVAGIPLFAQLAGQLAEREFVVLRYDKRGTGQSGGRTERVTLQDYADDAVAAVKWLAKRKDVDSERDLRGRPQRRRSGRDAGGRGRKEDRGPGARCPAWQSPGAS